MPTPSWWILAMPLSASVEIPKVSLLELKGFGTHTALYTKQFECVFCTFVVSVNEAH